MLPRASLKENAVLRGSTQCSIVDYWGVLNQGRMFLKNANAQMTMNTWIRAICYSQDAVNPFRLIWLVFGEDPAVRFHMAEQLTAL